MFWAEIGLFYGKDRKYQDANKAKIKISKDKFNAINNAKVSEKLFNDKMKRAAKLARRRRSP